MPVIDDIASVQAALDTVESGRTRPGLVPRQERVRVRTRGDLQEVVAVRRTRRRTGQAGRLRRCPSRRLRCSGDAWPRRRTPRLPQHLPASRRRARRLLRRQHQAVPVAVPRLVVWLGRQPRQRPLYARDPGSGFSSVQLKSLQVGTWECFVFVNCDGDAAPPPDWRGPLAGQAARMDVGYSSVKKYRRIEYDVAASWKVVAENSLECCHCRVAHRELVDLLDMDQFVRDVS